jgi:hypothetical protein
MTVKDSEADPYGDWSRVYWDYFPDTPRDLGTIAELPRWTISPVIWVVSMGRRNTQIEPDVH